MILINIGKQTMKKTSLFLILVATSLFITGCAQKVPVKALEPAEVDRIAFTKKIAITNFKNDRVGLSTKIEAILARHKLDNESYFTIVSRNDFDKIIKEQKVQNSGLIEQTTVVQVGSLIGAQAIVSGNVGRVGAKDTKFYEERYRCVDKKCKKMEVYKVRCKKRVVSLSSEIRIVDIARGDVIYADTLNEDATYKSCKDNSRSIPSVETISQKLATSMANKFTHKLLPHYRTFHVVLLEDPDLDYSDEQEKLLEISLKYIEQGRYDKAEQFLYRLIDSTSQQSYVAFYNLGVVKEVEGNYKEAKEYYKNADDLMLEPVEEISNAYIRISSLIEKRDRARAQINKGR